MLYQYAITPDAFEASAINSMTPAGVVLVQLLRGLCDNGLIANLHGGQWMTCIRRLHADKRVPPAVRDNIDTCLSKLYDQNRLIHHPHGSQDFDGHDFCWLHWSAERHRADADNPLSGIFSTDDYIELSEIDEQVFVPLSQALDSNCWLSRKQSVPLIHTESQLRSHLKPLLRYAQKVTLIDPYLNCREDRFFNTVQHCADLLGKHDGEQTNGRIHIHAADPERTGPEEFRESPSERLRRWKAALIPVADQWKHSFRVFLWGSKRGAEGFERKTHDRYIITEQCGVKAPGGLDFLPDSEEKKAAQTHWALLEAEDVRAIVLNEFHEFKSPYKLLDKASVNP